MKISAKQKEANRKKILSAAADLMGELGFDGVSMRMISKRAGIAEATIYNYFPDKESIVYGHFEDRSAEVSTVISRIGGWKSYTYREKFQTILETYLRLFAEDRCFVQTVFPRVFFSVAYHAEQARNARESFVSILRRAANDTSNKNDSFLNVSSPFFHEIMWEYFLGVVYYWIRDKSAGFNNTTVLVDKSLDFAEAAIASGMLDKGAEFLKFIFRAHIAVNMEKISSIFETFFIKKEKPEAPKSGASKKGNGQKRSRSKR